MEIYELLDQKLGEADLVLVGIGSGLQYDWNLIADDPNYSALVEQAGEGDAFDQFFSFLQADMLKKHADKDLESCFSNLSEKLKGKNYFIVTTTIDDTIFHTGFDTNRIVTPCGGFRKLQCTDNCSKELTDTEAIDWETISSCYQAKTLPETYHKLTCPHCGKELVFNQIGTGTYCEQGYLDQWSNYTKWLMGTMHKKVVLLELGVGLEFPTIIRSPFEKMVTYNQTATLFRVHPTMNQLFLGEEVLPRAFGIRTDVRDFVRNWK